MLRNLTIASILLTLSCEKSIPMTEIAPTPKKIPYELTAHGNTRIDNYYWLRDDTRSKPEVIEYLKEENSYADAWFKARRSYKNEIVDELMAKLPNTEISFPYQNGAFKYFSIQYKDKQLPIYYRSLNKENELILDPNIKFSEYDYYNVAATNPSPNNALLAFAEDTSGRREYVIKFLNIEQENLLADELTHTTGNIIWLDNQTILYLQKDPTTLIANKVYLHKLGDAQATDQLIYEESDPEFNMNLYQSIDKSIALINI
jgi:oligopeptidase B